MKQGSDCRASSHEYAQLQAKLAVVEAKLLAWHRADKRSRRLAGIPGIGPIGATLLTMKTPALEAFRSGLQFAAWIGLTPKDHSTAGKVRLGVITRAAGRGVAQRAGRAEYLDRKGAGTSFLRS